MHLAREYWAWTGGNIGALPLEALATFLAGVIFRRPLARFISWIRREERERAAKAAEDAAVSRRIAADLYERMTGEKHRTEI